MFFSDAINGFSPIAAYPKNVPVTNAHGTGHMRLNNRRQGRSASALERDAVFRSSWWVKIYFTNMPENQFH